MAGERDRFVLIRCEDGNNVRALVELLRMELNERNWHFKVASGEELYYTVSDMIEDISTITLINTLPEESEEE